MKVTITHQEIRQAFKLPEHCEIEITGATQKEVKERAPRRPSRRFKMWSQDEVALIEANSRKSNKDLANFLGRSVGAVAVKKSEIKKKRIGNAGSASNAYRNSALNYTA